MQRIYIYPKDIQTITGKSDRYARECIKNLKTILKKEKHQDITIKEYCTYKGIQIEDIIHLLK